jgi:ribosomal protein S1
MSWTKRVQHPSEVVKKGDGVQYRHPQHRRDNKRISLGLGRPRGRGSRSGDLPDQDRCRAAPFA